MAVTTLRLDKICEKGGLYELKLIINSDVLKAVAWTEGA